MADIRIGVFGAWRGNSYIKLMMEEERIDLIAICDKNIHNQEKDHDFKDIALFEDFDEFLDYGKKNGMNAVFLANYFWQHAPFAIKAMEAGMDVVSECTAANTLKECVELVEAVERTGRKYMIAENYPFMTMNLKMNKIIESGALGRLVYAEGEYNHSGKVEEYLHLAPGTYHWRRWLPKTYYVTHAMGPLMYMSKSMPKYVSARAAHSDRLYARNDIYHNYDAVGMMFCEMDNGMIARFTGCTAMASDYSRYRICGDIAGVEDGGYIPDHAVRMFYFDHTKPEDWETNVKVFPSDLKEFGEKGEKAEKAGHGGGDFWIVQNMIDYFADGKVPFFDVYKAVAMAATAILGWRSCLNHGENFKIPDFTNVEERNAVRDDDLNPFPDENGNGITLPCAVPFEE